MSEHPSTEDPDTPWSPVEGELLPRAAEAFGVRIKLETYSLDLAHEKGGPKARGFERILGITLDEIGYLEGAIYTGIVLVPVSEVRDNAPWGIKCAVDIWVGGHLYPRDRRQGRPRDHRQNGLAVRRTRRPAATCNGHPEALDWRYHDHTRQADNR